MIAVAITELLAKMEGGPQVVPVDAWRKGRVSSTLRMVHNVGWCASAEFVDVTESLVGQRVALAWRETCPTCKGRNLIVDNLVAGFSGVGACPNCTNGERMVVGWTAEVEAVVPIVDQPGCGHRHRVHVCRRGGNLKLHYGDLRTDVDLSHLHPLADWSPGRYALVLRDVLRIADTDFVLLAPDRFGDPTWTLQCCPFHGFAELDEVLVD